MKFLTLFFVACCISLSLASFFPSLSTPAIFWSGKSHFTNGQTIESVLTTQVDATLSTLCGADVGQNSLDSTLGSYTDMPELIVMWLEPKLRTSQFSRETGAYSNEDTNKFPLKEVIESATSSYIFPYIYGIPSVDIFENTMEHVKNSGGIVVNVGESEGSVSTLELKDFLSKNKDLFSNGKVDIVLVRAEASDISPIFQEIEQLVHENTNGNYVSVYSAEQITSVDVTETLKAYPYKTYWPRSLWEGLIVTLILIGMLFVGIAMIYAIKSPIRFATEMKKLKPEALQS